jgi:hypothetical protein
LEVIASSGLLGTFSVSGLSGYIIETLRSETGFYHIVVEDTGDNKQGMALAAPVFTCSRDRGAERLGCPASPIEA